MPTPDEDEDELYALQLRDLREKRQNAEERRWLWFIAAILIAVGLKVTGTV